MPFVLAIAGVILVIAAVHNSQGDLATALETDVPGYAKWATAIFGIGALGWIPGMREPSRMLLALVVVVLVLTNYQNILDSFKGLASAPAPAPATPTPAAAYASSTGQSSQIPVTPHPTTTSASAGGSTALSGSPLPKLPSLAASAAGSAVGSFVSGLLTI